MLSFQYFSRGECLPDVTLEGQPSNSRSLSARSDPVIKRSSFSCHSLLPYSLTARVGSLSSVALFGLHLQYGIIFVGYSHLHGLFFITERVEEYSDIFNQVVFVKLPPYSPDLNPIEQVWRITRRENTHNRFFPSLAALENAVDTAFQAWAKPNAQLRSLCTFK